MALIAAVDSATPPRGVLPAAPIDRAHLSRFTFGNVDLEIEVLGLFAQQAPETLAQLADASSPKAWRDAAHTMKGSARAVGAWQVANAAEHAERQPFASDPSLRHTLIEEIRAALDRAVDYVHGLAATT